MIEDNQTVEYVPIGGQGENDPVGAPWLGPEVEPENSEPENWRELMAEAEADLEADLMARKQAEEVKYQAQELQRNIAILEHALLITIMDFEHETGRKVDSVYTHERSSLPMEGYFSMEGQEKFFSERPGLEAAIKDRLIKVTVGLKKEEVG
jgi:hypothetical protein